MREDRNDRVVRRSGTGGNREPERERRVRVRMFEDENDLYQNDRDSGYDRHPRYVEEDRYDGYDRAPRYAEERDRDRRYRDEETRYEASDRRNAPKREAPRRQAGGPKRNRTTSNTERFVHQVSPYLLFWLALFGGVSLVLRDLVGLDGTTGEFGNWFADFLCGLMGPIAYALPLFFVVIALRWKKYVKEGILFKKLLLSCSFLVLLAAIVHVFMEVSTNGDLVTDAAMLYNAGMIFSGGGLFGGFVGEYLGYVLRAVGTGMLAIPLLLIIGIYMIGLTPGGLWRRVSLKWKQMSERRREREAERYDGKEERRLRVSKQKPEKKALGEEEQAKLGSGAEASAEKKKDYYEFGGELEDPIPPVPRPKRTPIGEEKPREKAVRGLPEVDLVDIPDDEPEDVIVTPAAAPVQERAASRTAEQELNDILRRLEEEKNAPAAPQPSVAPPADEEKDRKGSYYAPFALPVRPEPRHEREEKPTAGHIVITPQSAQEAQQAPAASAAAVESVEERLGASHEEVRTSYENGVHTEYHPSTTIYKREAVARPVTVAEEVPSYTYTATAAVEEPTPVAEPVAPTPVQKAAETPITRVEAAPVTFAEPAVTFEEPVEEAEEPAAPVRPSRPAFEMPGEEPAAKEIPVVSVATPAAPVERERPAPVKPVRPTPIATRTEAVKDEAAPAAAPPPTPREHVLPPIHLLNEDKTVKETNHEAENQEKINILRETLASFNVRIRDQIECARGPAITRYEFRPEIGVSVRQVINRQDDMSLALAADVRIEAPVPGKPVIGIEVPNAVRETVFMRTLLESEQFKNSKKPLEVPMGLGIGGNIVMCDLAAMPHVLVAGTTGSGKSVCINTILISLMYKTSPRDLRLILIDPKKVEFAAFAHVPHLYLPIVTEMPRAVGALACAVQEMERRYTLMEDVGARNIEEYNDLTKNDPDREHLPYMVIVIDEFADLKMGSTTNDPENFTCRIAQKARAAGMHLIIGTQRPSVDVITGKLKNNIPSRIAFTVKSQIDSRTILDAIGAESLCGKGDMLYLPVSQNKPSRVQGAYVSGREVESVIRYIIEHNDEVQYNREFMDQIEVEMARAANAGRKSNDSYDDVDDGDDGGEDPKFREAVELAIETQKVATSLLQRRLGVGYGRAAKIIDRMEELGYVSAPEGNKARKVLITYQEFVSQMDSDGDYEEDEYNT